MRISESDHYGRRRCTWLDECGRAYCHAHRLLYRTCETAEEGWEGDGDVIGGLHRIVEVSGECPECLRESRQKRYQVLDKP
jgi:hypothetical protein